MEQEGVIDQPAENIEGKKRPVAITVICLIGFIGVGGIPWILFSPVARHIGSWYPTLSVLTLLAGLICFIGLWKMKRWAVYSYTGLVVIGQIIAIATGRWHILGLLI